MKRISTLHLVRTKCKLLLRERRDVSNGKKWTSFNAGVSLTDEEVRQLTDAACEIYPMQWVDTDKNAHLRRDKDYVSVPAKCKSRLVGCGNFETTDGRRTDSAVGDVDSHNYRLQLVRNGYFQGQENSSNLAVTYSSCR